MRNARRIFVLALLGLALSALLLWAAFSGTLGPEDSIPTTLSGISGLLIFGIAGYFSIAAGTTARAISRLAVGVEVVARWTVPVQVWQHYRDIQLAETGLKTPMLEGLLFSPRAAVTDEAVEIICGARGVLIDGRYFALVPGRGTGMEQAGLILTNPPCVAIIIGMLAGAHGSPRTTRWLLLLPIPPEARDEANKAIQYYAAATHTVRDVVDLARAHPRRANALFWSVLIAAVLMAVVGIVLEVSDYPGELPAMLGITGIMITLGVLVIAAAIRFSRGRRKARERPLPPSEPKSLRNKRRYLR